MLGHPLDLIVKVQAMASSHHTHYTLKGQSRVLTAQGAHTKGCTLCLRWVVGGSGHLSSAETAEHLQADALCWSEAIFL